MRRWHLTNDEKKEIRRLTRAGVRQSVIARTLHITAPSVSKAQREMGLPTRLVILIPEEKIMRLFGQGHGGYAIARKLHIPACRVFKVAHKHNFQRQGNTGVADPEADVTGFVEAVKRRDDHIKNLAEKFHIGQVKANKLAHEVLQTIRFRPGRSRPALSSAFPQRHFGPSVKKR